MKLERNWMDIVTYPSGLGTYRNTKVMNKKHELERTHHRTWTKFIERPNGPKTSPRLPHPARGSQGQPWLAQSSAHPRGERRWEDSRRCGKENQPTENVRMAAERPAPIGAESAQYKYLRN